MLVDRSAVENDPHLVKYSLQDGDATRVLYCSREWAAKHYANVSLPQPSTTPNHLSQNRSTLAHTQKRRRQTLAPRLTGAPVPQLNQGSFNPALAMTILDRLNAEFKPVKPPRQIDPALAVQCVHWRDASRELAEEGKPP